MEQRRLFIAIGLSMAFLFLWQMLFPPPAPRKKAPVATSISSDTGSPVPDSPPVLAQAPASSPVPADSTSLDSSVRQSLIPSTPPRSVTIELPRYTATLDETGGILSSLALTDFTSLSLPPRGLHPVSLVSHILQAPGHLSLLVDQDDRSRLGQSRWILDSVQESRIVSFSTIPGVPELPTDIRIEKKLEFTDDYGSTLDITIFNLSDKPRALSTGRLRYDLQDKTREGSLVVHLGPDLGNNAPVSAYIDQYMVTGSHERDGKHEVAVLAKSWWHGLFGAPAMPEGVKWAALENRYFVVAVEPSGFTVDALFHPDEKKRLHLFLLLPSFNLDPGQSKTFSFRIFSGPKSTQLLQSFDPAFKQLDGMEPTILPRSIEIARWMVSFLGWIQKHVGNWGWSIIILTIIVRGLLFPLSYYQFKSMARMQQLQPRIAELQSRYAADKERLQRELMKVYSEAGVNPIGGCLPILLQMPILIGLFLAFQSAIELRGVPFMLWIKDLSVPDTLAHIPLLGIPINPLPLLMCGTMLYQQKITPMTTTDPAQKQIFMMMPVIMTVMFYNFPSGLSLYWVVQNILSIGQQYYMMKLKKEVTQNAVT
ncbi:MAG: membrane protein insertase YidC [Candidatus Hydrogenedentota bacterium]